MRNGLWFLILCSSLAVASTELKVEANGLLRLPGNLSSLEFERLIIAQQGALLVPASVTNIRIGQLSLESGARISISPSEQPLQIEAESAYFAKGSEISARGTPGSVLKPAIAGRDLNLKLSQVRLHSLVLDVQGGKGAQGYRGLDGANGQAGGCLWGSASSGHDGQDGGDGSDGTRGGNIYLEVPAGFNMKRVEVRLAGGEGGEPGEGGRGGRGGAAKGCWVYTVKGAADGQSGEPGQPGAAGSAGTLSISTPVN